MKNRSSTISPKKKSSTSETRLSHSNIFNNSSLLQTKLIENSQPHIMPSKKQLSKKQNELCHQIRKSQNKQVQFLRIKNRQLEQKNMRITKCLIQLQTNKRDLLQMNKKYVSIVNQYYQDQQKKARENRNLQSHTEINKVMEQLERDHRNLSKHCIVMEQQIKNYAKQIQKYHELKDQLYQANHSNVTELLQQIYQLSEDNKTLKKQNNRLNYEVEKYKNQLKIMSSAKSGRQQQLNNFTNELQKMKSLINTTQQQSQDKAKRYEAQIYEMDLKIQKLEQQLREYQINPIASASHLMNRQNRNKSLKNRNTDMSSSILSRNSQQKLRINSSSKASNKAVFISSQNKSGLKKLLNQERKTLAIK